MLRLLKRLVLLGAALVLAAVCYGALGFRDALNDAPGLATRADALLGAGQGGADLGRERLGWLLAVEDPAFDVHSGFDLTTPGAGVTTITQSLAKREGFADFTPGLQKLRQTGYALGLEMRLSKPQIMALFLDSVPMGQGPDGAWIDGFFAAARAHYGAGPAVIAPDDYKRLLAVLIAPGNLQLAAPDDALATRVARIDRLIAGDCRPSGHRDVWLTGCAESG